MATAGAALVIAIVLLYLGRRDLTRPAVAFGVIWFGSVAMAQLRLTELESPWSTGFTVLVFAGGLTFIVGAVLAGGTAPARGSVTIDRESYLVKRLVAAAIVLIAGGVVGVAYKAHVLDGLPLLSENANEVRARAYKDGDVTVPAWSSALTNGFFLAMWCALAALWLLPRPSPRRTAAGLWLLAAVALFGVTLLASRNTILFAVAVPLVGLYLLAGPRRPAVRVAWYGAAAAVIALVVGGLFVVRSSQVDSPDATFLERESERQPAVLRPLLPFYINGVYPLEGASRLYRKFPESRPYGLGVFSFASLPDILFPGRKTSYGGAVAEHMTEQRAGGVAWAVGSYQGRLYGDAGWPGVMLGSLLLGLAFGALYRWARSRRGFVAVVMVGYLAYYAAFMTYDNFLSFSIIAVFDIAVIALVELFASGRLDALIRSFGLRLARVGATS